MSKSNDKAADKMVRISPLGGIAQPGVYGAERDGGPGVKLAVRHPRSIVTLIARKGMSKKLSSALKKHYGVTSPAPGHSSAGKALTLHWAGPEQWFAVAEGREEGQLYQDLAERLKGLASVSDQSHGRITLSVSGPCARDVLAKGTPVDLHPTKFGDGRCAVTQMAHVGVHLALVGDDAFEISLFRGFAVSFWEWLTEMSQEFGYEVI